MLLLLVVFESGCVSSQVCVLRFGLSFLWKCCFFMVVVFARQKVNEVNGGGEGVVFILSNSSHGRPR